VIAGNEYLAGRARQAKATRVEYLPSVVDVARYAQKQDISPSPLKIGWIGSPVTAPYLDIVREAVNELAREVPIELVLIGSGKSNPFPSLPTEFLSWNEEGELAIGLRFDLGIMPLVDGPFERGKCGYKLVQYMAAGLPVIASPVGINRQMVLPGENGYLASSTQEWLGALRQLAGKPELRRKMGQAGRQRAEQMYNLQVTAPRLFELLSSVVRA